MIFEPATSSTTITFLLVSTVLAAIWLENSVRAFRKLGAAALSIINGMLLSNVGLIPGQIMTRQKQPARKKPEKSQKKERG